MPLHGPLDCDLIGLPRPSATTPPELLGYALFAFVATAANARHYAMATFHDWLIASSNRIWLLDALLERLALLEIKTVTVAAAGCEALAGRGD